MSRDVMETKHKQTGSSENQWQLEF